MAALTTQFRCSSLIHRITYKIFLLRSTGDVVQESQTDTEVTDQQETSASDNDDQQNEECQIHKFSMATFNIWCPVWKDHNTANQESHHPKLWKKRNGAILNILSGDADDEHQNGNPNDVNPDDVNPDAANHENVNPDDVNHEDLKQNESDPAPIANDSYHPPYPPMNCDLYCIQEFWCDGQPFNRLFESYLKPKGYEIYSLKRHQKGKPDGIAMIYNTNTLKLHEKMDVKYTVSNRVAIIMELEHIASGCRVQIGNTHFTSGDDEWWKRERQCEQFMDALEQFKEKKNGKNGTVNGDEQKDSDGNTIDAVICCGDYNCELNGNKCTETTVTKGYKSTFHELNSDLFAAKQKVVSHLTHDHYSILCDHIFFKPTEDATYTVEPAESYLYPQSIETDKWYPEWILSDHRPLVTTFTITSKK